MKFLQSAKWALIAVAALLCAGIWWRPAPLCTPLMVDLESIAPMQDLMSADDHNFQLSKEPKPQMVHATSLPPSWMPRMSSERAATFFQQQKAVQGWFFDGAMYAILLLMRMQLEVKVSGALGEIGVHHGKLTTFLAFFARKDNVDGHQLFAADLFEGLQHLNVDRSGRGNFGAFKKALALSDTSTENFVVFTGPSQTLNTSYFVKNSLNPFRMFSVDGGHTRETALSDLLLIEQHVAQGGIVFLDDFLRKEWWGVTQAAGDYKKAGGKLVPFAFIGNKLFYTTPSHWNYYRQGLRADPFLSKMIWPLQDPNTHRDTTPSFQAGNLLSFAFGEMDWYNASENLSAELKNASSALLDYFEIKTSK